MGVRALHAYVFAFESAPLGRLGEEMCELAETTPFGHRLDGIWTLDHGSLLWNHPETGYWLPDAATPIEVQAIDTDADEAATCLPLMVMMLQALLQSTFTPPFKIGAYMEQMPLGERRCSAGWIPA